MGICVIYSKVINMNYDIRILKLDEYYVFYYQSQLSRPEAIVSIAMFLIPSLVASAPKLWIAWRISL